MAADLPRSNGTFEGVTSRLLDRARAAADGSLSRRPDLREPSISQRLQAKFGLGDQPLKRQALYRQLELLAERHLEEMLRIISEAVVGAAGAREPGRYFCVSVKAKIAAAGLSVHSEDARSW